ncbi:protein MICRORCHIDIA 7-like [Castanea sativa]|uniref:protein MICRORCHIDIA 7-like n=1 Tax=Castanea sativa TaxID=21020 RepID=UPI003F6536A7
MFLIKQEKPEIIPELFANTIDISSSDSSGCTESSDTGNSNAESFLESVRMSGDNKRRSGDIEEGSVLKKPRKLEKDCSDVVLPPGFLSSLATSVNRTAINALPLSVYAPPEKPAAAAESREVSKEARGCKQFWKAGDYEISNGVDSVSTSAGMDHVRVHPKFLHSNATSHKWALGAFAELLDNALDEVCNGATLVHVDVLQNMKSENKNHMLLVEDNGGGMTPDKMRQCMSLGYSAKSKIANTIGQYGNGFKTSTMRLGADVIVFSRCQGNDGQSFTQSIGILSYTFLRATGKEDIVVPMIQYEKRGQSWNKVVRSSLSDWNRNLTTIVEWSPYASEEDLLKQFDSLKDHGTRIIIYNLWEDDEGKLELDLDTDPHDIQLRGVNRDEKNIQMSEQYPNSRHFLTYRHSLRSYASILYLKLPPNFRIILRGKDVQHHNIVNDMMLAEEVTYKPVAVNLPEGIPKDSNKVAVVTIGFVKDARAHIDVQGFNVYHKNRLIKPFWRVWNAAGSDGRGVIGVLEANFIEPAHDKQGFERTTVLARLEQRLNAIQKKYWSTNCQEVGYAARRRQPGSPVKVSHKEKSTSGTGYCLRQCTTNSPAHEYVEQFTSWANQNRRGSTSRGSKPKSSVVINARSQPVGSASEDESFHEASPCSDESQSQQDPTSNGIRDQMFAGLPSKAPAINGDGQVSSNGLSLIKVKEEDLEPRERMKELCSPEMAKLLNDLQKERERSRILAIQLQEKEQKLEDMDKEQEILIDIISKERDQKIVEENKWREKLRDASNTIELLIEKVKQLEGRKG